MLQTKAKELKRSGETDADLTDALKNQKGLYKKINQKGVDKLNNRELGMLNTFGYTVSSGSYNIGIRKTLQGERSIPFNPNHPPNMQQTMVQRAVDKTAHLNHFAKKESARQAKPSGQSTGEKDPKVFRYESILDRKEFLDNVKPRDTFKFPTLTSTTRERGLSMKETSNAPVRAVEFKMGLKKGTGLEIAKYSKVSRIRVH